MRGSSGFLDAPSATMQAEGQKLRARGREVRVDDASNAQPFRELWTTRPACVRVQRCQRMEWTSSGTATPSRRGIRRAV